MEYNFSKSGDIKSVISSQFDRADEVAVAQSIVVAAADSRSSKDCISSSSSANCGSFRSSGSGSNMDELSIDSATNEKVKIDNNNAKKQQQQHQKAHHQDKHLKDQQQQRSHFKIEWRQLTYYEKERSYLSKLFFNDKKKHCETSNGDQIKKDEGGQGEPKRILNSLDGCFRSGELSAILGPSGAGKSTFLSTLFGSKQEGAYGQTKVTWFNGQPGDDYDNATKQPERRSIKIASLPQHDHLLNHLTVYESLMFASKIKNATRPVTGKNFHRQNVRRVAKMLKLSDCLDTRCGKLSGGQYKRVSIGQELLSEPDVIILDEPTSGLDAMTCLTTVQTLKSIAMKHPISIILTIHQPDIDVFNLFDHVYVIAQGGLAIYEGPPDGIVSTLAQVNLKIPSSVYNPARFIVENAFVFEPGSNNVAPEAAAAAAAANVIPQATKGSLDINSLKQQHISDDPGGSAGQSEDDDDDDDEDDGKEKQGQGYLRRSMVSLTEVISGKEMVSKRKDKKPLLNIGIQTSDGKFITSDQLARNRDRELQIERWNLLKRLNQIQKERYRTKQDMKGPTNNNNNNSNNNNNNDHKMDCNRIDLSPMLSEPVSPENPIARPTNGGEERSSAKSDYSSSGWSVNRKQITEDHHSPGGTMWKQMGKATSLSQIPSDTQHQMDHHQNKTTMMNSLVPGNKLAGRSLQTVNSHHTVSHGIASGSSDNESDDILSEDGCEFVSVNFDQSDRSPQKQLEMETHTNGRQPPINDRRLMMKRQFDKRLSAKHNCSKQKGYPILYHAFLLAHRTWLSIVRDPIFFGIQACLHTTIPILLSLIFGSIQEEGCPRLGDFDLVEFAYSDSDNMIKGTMSNIRKSIGNVGIVFFEMFVLIFSINCITALVFPLDMYVLLKEYRNGWYSLRSYLFGRTLADLPVPVILHTLAMTIIYFMTSQPHSAWRFGSIVGLVIIASVVAQSVGLTIGALLMKSSQSSVLAAAGIVAPFFALSGFIVRIHTLPLVAQFAAKCSYLYHLLNGFIILRYGFGRCQCKEEDFEHINAHPIPSNLHTMASMWIGTYSNEYANSQAMLNQANNNRTNVDPNIDIVDKMMTAFKMANSYGHQIEDCNDVLPYAMLDFNVRDQDIYGCVIVLILMAIISRFITFGAIYYKIRSYA